MFRLIVIAIDHLKHEGRQLSGDFHLHGMGAYLDRLFGLFEKKIELDRIPE